MSSRNGNRRRQIFHVLILAAAKVAYIGLFKEVLLVSCRGKPRRIIKNAAMPAIRIIPNRIDSEALRAVFYILNATSCSA
jgi:hypothetical protein